MKVIVQKYGGSSVSTVQNLRNVAKRVIQCKQQGYAVVAVVSAMGDSTDDLLTLARELSSDPSRRELDALMATGEIVSMSLLAIAIQEMGTKAVALNGLQCGIFTNDVHSNARILEVRPERIQDHLMQDEIVVVAGFQGFSSKGDFTTLGRGGSDTSAVALAAALNADHCEIYTDVPGVFSADPRLVPQARYLEELNAVEMQELAWTGAKVLKAEAVEFASTNGLPIVVRSTFEDGHDTVIHPDRDSRAIFRPRRPEVAGVSGRKDVIRIIADWAAFSGALGEEIFEVIARYDLVLAVAGSPTEPVDILISNLEMPDPVAFARELRRRFAGSVTVADELGVISLVGFGLGSRPGAFFAASTLLRDAGIPVARTFTTRESLSFVVPCSKVDEGVVLMHRAFVEACDAENIVAATHSRSERREITA